MTNALEFSHLCAARRLEGLRIAIIEDHALLAQSLRIGLAAEGAVVHVVSLHDPDQVVADCLAARPHLALLDLGLGGAVDDGGALVSRLAATEAKVLVLTGVTDPVRLAACLDDGAVAVISKTEDLELLVEQMCAASGGERVMPAQARLDLLSRARRERDERHRELAPFDALTERECDVLIRLMSGKPVEEIGCELVISEATVRSHVRGILVKLGARSQLAAVALAHEAGWPLGDR